MRAEEGHERHDQLLADGVDGRVGHLREELLEVPVEELRLFGENRQRLVGPHGADRLVAGDRHGVEDQLDVLAGIAEVLLAAEQAAGLGRGRRDRAEEAMDGDLVLLHPAPVGLAPREPGLDLHVLPHPASRQVDQDHLPGPEGALLLHLLGREVEHPRLGGEHHEPVLGDGVARGPQAVAVEQGPDHVAVAEGHRGGAVPGLHQARVKLEEAAQVGSHGVLRPPRLGDEHEHGVLDVAAAGGEQLEHVVEAGGVAAALVDDRQQLLEVGAEQVGLQLRLARADPVEVAAQGVDLAVVRQVAERLSKFPGGERVGAVALVDDGQGALEQRLVEVQVEGRDLGRHHEAFVDHGAAREAGNVEASVGAQRLGHRSLALPAGDVELALERLFAQPGRIGEALPDRRTGRPGRLAQGGRLDRHLAPAEDAQTFAREGLVHDRLAGHPGLGLQGHEHHGRPVAAGLRQREPERAACVLEEAVRDLHENAGSVTGARVGAGGATMQQVVEHLDATLHDGVRGFAAYVTDETDPARVLLVAGIVEALRRGQSPRSTGVGA